MKILLLILTFTLPAALLACDDVNLFDESAQLKGLEIVNQGDMNTCYAHSMAALYNIENATHESERVHPYWLAFNHKKRLIHWTPRNLDYSILSWSYNDLKRRGNCSYEETAEKFYNLKRGVAYSDDQLMYLIKAFFKSKKGKDLEDNEGFLQAIDQTLARVQDKSNSFERSWSRPELVKVLSALRGPAQEMGFYRFLGSRVFDHCSKRNNQEVDHKLKNFARGFGSNRKIASRLENILGEGKSVAVGYCARTTYKQNPNDSKNIDRFPRIMRALSLKCGSHYSVLVGSRPQGNSCQYLLRNSYGQGFWAHESFECYCHDETTGQNRNCRKSESNNPNLKVLGCWIDREKLLSNTFDLSYF